MTRDEIIEAIRAIVPRLREEHGVVSIGLFGSVARGDDRPESDLDIAVRFADEHFSMDDMATVVIAVEDAVGRQVDLLVLRDGLRPSLARALDRDLIRVA